MSTGQSEKVMNVITAIQSELEALPVVGPALASSNPRGPAVPPGRGHGTGTGDRTGDGGEDL
jgi:hypothetical protein